MTALVIMGLASGDCFWERNRLEAGRGTRHRHRVPAYQECVEQGNVLKCLAQAHAVGHDAAMVLWDLLTRHT